MHSSFLSEQTTSRETCSVMNIHTRTGKTHKMHGGEIWMWRATAHISSAARTTVVRGRKKERNRVQTHPRKHTLTRIYENINDTETTPRTTHISLLPRNNTKEACACGHGAWTPCYWADPLQCSDFVLLYIKWADFVITYIHIHTHMSDTWIPLTPLQ